MSSLSSCTFVLFLLLSYALCDGLKLVEKNASLPKVKDIEQYTPEQQISHSAAVAGGVLKDSQARQKRSQSEFGSSEYKDFSDIIDDLEDNALAAGLAPNAAFENMSPLIYQLILQKLRQLQANEQGYRVLTPRLGRSIDFRHPDTTFGLGNNVDDGVDISSDGMRQQKPFVSRLIKKSVPFKPRLGKRTQQSMLCN